MKENGLLSCWSRSRQEKTSDRDRTVPFQVSSCLWHLSLFPVSQRQREEIKKRLVRRGTEITVVATRFSFLFSTVISCDELIFPCLHTCLSVTIVHKGIWTWKEGKESGTETRNESSLCQGTYRLSLSFLLTSHSLPAAISQRFFSAFGIHYPLRSWKVAKRTKVIKDWNLPERLLTVHLFVLFFHFFLRLSLLGRQGRKEWEMREQEHGTRQGLMKEQREGQMPGSSWVLVSIPARVVSVSVQFQVMTETTAGWNWCRTDAWKGLEMKREDSCI